jgi:hypothetical protein
LAGIVGKVVSLSTHSDVFVPVVAFVEVVVVDFYSSKQPQIERSSLL